MDNHEMGTILSISHKELAELPNIFFETIMRIQMAEEFLDEANSLPIEEQVVKAKNFDTILNDLQKRLFEEKKLDCDIKVKLLNKVINTQLRLRMWWQG